MFVGNDGLGMPWDDQVGFDDPTHSSFESSAAAGLPPERPRLTAGAVVGQIYRIDRMLGEGGSGQVYLAHDTVLDRPVALKLISAARNLSSGPRAVFLKEARAMARIRHQNVVALYSLGQVKGTPFLVMEYVDGGDLQTWVQHRGPLEFDEAMAILSQVCDGLQALHDAGLVHRDVKPSNVLMGASFRVAITDLGLARAAHAPNASGEYRMEGTPAYMAPEVIGNAAVQPALASRVDVYGLGVLAFELLTGTVPFTAPNPVGVLLAALTQDPPAPSTLRAGLSPLVDQAILAALRKDPAERTATPAQFLQSMAGARDGQTLTPIEPLRFVVADDDPVFRTFAAAVVRKSYPHASIALASDGQRALELLDGDEPTTVAILDLIMPKLNAIEVVTSLRSAGRRRPRIAVVSAERSAVNWPVLAKHGIDTFLLKPTTVGQLRDAVRRLVSLSGAPDQAEPETGSGPNEPVADSHFAPAARAPSQEVEDQVRAARSSAVVQAILTGVQGGAAVLNGNRQIVGLNMQLQRALGIADPARVLGLRPGEAFGCVHASDMPGGCGTGASCRKCGAVIAIVMSQASSRPASDKCALTVLKDGIREDHSFDVDTSPIEVDGHRFTLLFLRETTAEQRRAYLVRSLAHAVERTVNDLVTLVGAMPTDDDLPGSGKLRAVIEQLRTEVQTQRVVVDAHAGEYAHELGSVSLEPFLAELHSLAVGHPAAAGKRVHGQPT